MIMWLMVGTPGSGKSTFAKNILFDSNTMRYISRDEIRFSILRKGDNYFAKEKKVYDEFIRKIKAALDDEDNYLTSIIVDATHLNWTSRRKLLSALGMLNGQYSWVKVIPVIMNTSVNECINRNAKRFDRERVPDDKLIEMEHSKTHPKDDPFKYTAILEVDGTGDFK